MATSNGKDTIYIDVDDEITTVIDKVRTSRERIVALVLPKRATTFQSSVNMKLLKRTADEAHKKIVLITSETGLIPLAAAAGLHVASTLQSKPEVPVVATEPASSPRDVEETVNIDNRDISPEKDGNRPVGELAAAAGASALSPLKDDIETLNIEDEQLPEDATDEKSAATGPVKKPKGKGLHVPNFERFRLLMVLGAVLLIALIVGVIFALKVLPKAEIDIKTDSTTLASSMTVTLDTRATALDATQKVVPAQTQQEQKTFSQQVPATGQKNEGTKASGSVVMSIPCADVTGSAPQIPAGTGVSSNGLTFITQSTATLSNPDFSNGCHFTDTTDITAQIPGAKYNLGANTSFSVAGYPDVSATNGSALTGGTDKIVTVVSQSDVDAAKKKLGGQNVDSVRQDLAQQLEQDNLFAVTGTFASGTPSYTTDAQVGDSASSVTVTETITYTMYGVKKSDLQSLVKDDVKSQIDPSKQSILSEGIDEASFKVTDKSATSVQVSMSATAVAGPDLKIADIKKAAAGKKGGDVQSMLKANPGVTSVVVRLSPFWVSSVPNNPDKITVHFSKPTATKSNASSS
ncbi:MAG TPA: hypothetical protein VHD60_00415 [Candidatus Saccharimonadales bacterium]|nr:hypothetical protein [Candidatus Saccharimonadales bacterium]